MTRSLLIESPRLRELVRRGEVPAEPNCDPVITPYPWHAEDPDGRHGERQGRRVERAKRKRARVAGEELIAHPALTGEE